MHLRGSVAIVTGGTRGIGKAIVEAILRRGGKVCFTGVNSVSGKMAETNFNETFGAQSALFVRCDVTNEMEFQELFKTAKSTFKKIDIVVNNAGILNEDTWEKMIDVNLNGTVRGTRLAIENMRKDICGSGGIILNISSLGGIHPAAFHPAYCATKFGIVGYTRSWAVNPRVNEMGLQFATLCPAFCETDMATEAFLTGTSTTFLDFDGCMETARDTKARLGVNRWYFQMTSTLTSELGQKVLVLTSSMSGKSKKSYWQAFSYAGDSIDEAFFHLGSVSLESTVADALDMEEVARVFLEIVEKENCNGDVVTLVAKEGTEYLYRD